MIGSLNTESRVLEVVRVVKDVRGGILSDMVYVETMSPRVGMTTSLSVVTTEAIDTSSSWPSEDGGMVAKLSIGRGIAEPVTRGEGGGRTIKMVVSQRAEFVGNIYRQEHVL